MRLAAGLRTADVFVHENRSGECLRDQICLSNECSSRSKICCEECYNEFHPSHPERVYPYVTAYKALKSSMHERRMHLEKTLDGLSNAHADAQKRRSKYRDKIMQQFAKIEANCTMQFHADVATLKHDFQTAYQSTDMDLLKSIVESKSDPTELQDEQKSQLTNHIFSSFNTEFHPYLSMKLRMESKYMKVQQEQLQAISLEEESLQKELNRIGKLCEKVRWSTSAMKMIDYSTCSINKFLITSIGASINQILILNQEYMVVSHETPPVAPYSSTGDQYSQSTRREEVISVLAMNEEFRTVTFAPFPHVKLLDTKSNGIFIAQSRASFTKLKIVAKQQSIVQLKSIHLDEYVAQAEIIPEFNLLFICTKDTHSDIHHKVNLYDVATFTLIKRYSILIGSPKFLLSCSPALNLFAIADKRNLSFYNLLDGSFIRYFMIGNMLNDDILDIGFRKEAGNSSREILVVSNMQGMVTQIEFKETKISKRTIFPSSTSSDVFFNFIEELRLFQQPRILQIQVKKNKTLLINQSVGDCFKQANEQKQSQSQSQKAAAATASKQQKSDRIVLDEEYSAHACFSACSNSTSFTVFIGTVKGNIYVIQYGKST